MVELRLLDTIDLAVTFARKMGGNKIRHYRLTTADLLVAKFTDRSAEDIVREYIKKEENEDVTFLPARSNCVQVRYVSTVVLKDRPDIKRALEKRKITSQIHEYDVWNHPYKRFLNPIKKVTNYLIRQVNKLLARIQGTTLQEVFSFEKWGSSVNVNLLPYFDECSEFTRHFSPCHYLTVAFEEGDLEEATQSLLMDLEILNGHGMIIGHLTMPSMILLADKTGSGKSVFALFCFLFVDYEKLQKITNKTPLEFPENPLSLLGVKNDVHEGSFNYLNGVDPSSRYEIETIRIGESTFEENMKLHTDNYADTIDTVNKIAKKASSLMKDIKVVNKQSESFSKHWNQCEVNINADITGSDGRKTTVEELYRKNS